MYRGPSRFFKVVSRQNRHYAVWHADAHVPGEWEETGRFGTENECWDFLELREGSPGFLFRVYGGQ